MAFLQDPRWGIVPGAPYGTNWWTGNQFNISDLLRTMPPPPPPLAPSVTPQDTDAQAGAVELRTDTGGAQGGGGSGPGTGPGGLGRDPTDAERSPGYGFAGPGPLDKNSPAAGTWGVVDAPKGSPATFNSNYGLYGGLLGMATGTALGVPGIGTALGTIGENVDLAHYVDNLRAANIPIDPSYLSATWAGLSSLPVGMGNIFGTSARQQSENARRDALANLSLANMSGATTLGPTPIDYVDKAILENPEIFGLANVGYQGPSVPTFDPATLGREYGYGAAPGSTQGVMGAPQGQTGYASGIHGSGIGVGDSGVGTGSAPSSAGGAAQTSGAGGSAPGGGDTGRDTGFWRGGLVGAPLGRYAAGGAVPPQPGDNITPQQFGALRAINPPGPDDQIGALKTGEGVLTVSAMRQYPGLLAAANAGTLDPGRVKGLLAPAIAKPRRVR